MFSIALVGKPNVGKSTLFNKFVGKKMVITGSISGLTRDRKDFETEVDGMKLRIVDTAGVEEQSLLAKDINKIEKKMCEQAIIAISSVNLCLLIIDGRQEVTYDDIAVYNNIRRLNKDIILVINKCENDDDVIVDSCRLFYQLQCEHIVYISAEHKTGFYDLCSRIRLFYDSWQDLVGNKDVNVENKIRVAFIGRPNVGKSTIINKIIKEDRVITHDAPGTTRDSIYIDFKHKGSDLTIVDTAGIRKSIGADKVNLESDMVSESFHAIDLAHVVVLVTDVECGLLQQELSLLERAVSEGKGIIYCINKIDKVSKEKHKELVDEIIFRSKQISNIMIDEFYSFSAINDQDIIKVLDKAIFIYRNWSKSIKTSLLNNWLMNFTKSTKMPYVKNKELKLKFIRQIASKPHYFLISSNFIESMIPDNFIVNIKKSLIITFELLNMPIRVKFKKEENPFVNKK